MFKTVCIGFISCFLVACGEAEKKQNTTITDAVTVASDTAEMIETGQSIFLQQCASCHAVNMNLTGPYLKGVEKRWKSKEKLFAFIHNSHALIDAKDEYAQDLYYKWNKVQMPPFPLLKDTELTAILAYIKHAEKN